MFSRITQSPITAITIALTASTGVLINNPCLTIVGIVTWIVCVIANDK